VFYDGTGTLFEGGVSAEQIAPLEDPSVYRDVDLAVLWGVLLLVAARLLWRSSGLAERPGT
jgi:hypothetical protein